jgi:hypothetical protein
MPNVIVHAPADGLHNTGTASGRAYTASPGNPISVPDFDAQILCANGWMLATSSFSITQGPTSGRPGNPSAKTRYLDTTLGYEILFDGLVWRNPITGAVV